MENPNLSIFTPNGCNACGNPVKPLFSLGEMYVSNFIGPNDSSEGYPKSEISLSLCQSCHAAQLDESVDPDLMYKTTYWYHSDVNKTMRGLLKDVVDDTLKRIEYTKDDVWLDLACNCGTLLECVPSDFKTIGVDPANEEITGKARNVCDILVNDYFNDKAKKIVLDEGGAKVVTCVAMFYDLERPHDFLRLIKECMRDDGVLVLQMSYTPLMLRQVEFGNICAEHVMYYNVTSLVLLLKSCGFNVLDAELNESNGGSVRIYATKFGFEHHYGTQQTRDVGWFNAVSLCKLENTINHEAVWDNFYKKIIKLKDDLQQFLIQAKLEGKTVWGLGASTKANTVLQLFELGGLVDKMADRNPIKWGLKTIGTEIPIVSEEEFRAAQPDYAIIFPWFFAQEIIERESDYHRNGGKFIIPMPEPKII